MKKFVLAAIAALSLGVGSAYAAQTSNAGAANGTVGNNNAPAFVYCPIGG